MINGKEFYKNLVNKCNERLGYPYDEIIDAIGFDAMYKLMECVGGSTLYVPAPRKAFKAAVDKCVIDEFDGNNYAQLAKRYGYCERTIRNIVNGNDDKKQKTQPQSNRRAT